SFLVRHWNVDFNFLKREANKVADWLTRGKLEAQLNTLKWLELDKRCQNSPCRGDPHGKRLEWRPEGGKFSPWGRGWGKIPSRQWQGLEWEIPGPFREFPRYNKY
ncbi:hypothetical protein PIB30_082507, partial [Stylosanthes scabra]|nr:hypothetical protein [Stylosanthes scabra]